MRLALLFRGFLLLLVVTGCDSPWRSRFPVGTRLYEQEGHRFFGTVVGFDERHDFQNGTDPLPAILIEKDDATHTRLWGSCPTCSATFQVETAERK